jgi:hypothetical protein
MIQLSYISSAAQAMSTEQLLTLLQQCLNNNPKRGITGMLLYGNNTFAQTLEGDDDAVDALYEKILHDPRHTDVKSLRRKTVIDRQYADWSMGFKRVSDKELRHIGGIANFTEKDFNFQYLAGHNDVAESLMDHYSYWDPLVRQVDEKEQVIKQLKRELAESRGYVEIASLVLESVAEAGRTTSLDESHVRLCEFALDTFGQMQILSARPGTTRAA